VVSSRYALERRTRGSVHSLTARDLETVPEFGDDALRAATHLPGMASIGLSARPHVRGGLQDETLVLFNNVKLLEPFHLKDFQSVFSGFNPSLVDSIDIYTGGFPARYGDRMSGVMDIRPTADRPGFGAEVMVSFLTASAAVAGTTASERGRWLLSARRGNLDLVLDVLDPSVGSPKYADYFGSYSYALDARTELEVGFIFYDDDIELSELDDEDGELGRSVYRNRYGWMQLHRRWTDHMDSTTVVSFGHVRNHRSGFINDEDLEEGSSSLNDSRRFRLWHLGHRQNLTLSDAVALEFGGQLDYQEGRYDTEALIDLGEIADLIGIPMQEIRSIDRTARGTSGGLYGSVRYLPRQWLSLEGGVRWDYQDYGEEFEQYMSPRFSALVQLPTGTDLRFSAGRFYQPEEIHELQAADGVDTFQVAQYSDHYIVGLSHVFAHPSLSLGLELFDKRIHKPKRRFDNLFNSLVLMPELASDRVEVAPSRARARGVEFSLAYEPSTNVGLWGSYTHAYADDRLEDAWVPRGWDQRHTVSAGVAWHPGNWTFSAAALWHSGWQTTVLPAAVAEDEDPILERNADRLPEYFSLDLRVAREWRWAEQRLTVFFELTNATHRKNVGAYEYDVEEAEGGGYVLPREPVTLLPRMPSLGVRWNFR
jgi:outer membrane receptor protein involved in Fe transport